MEGDVMKKGGKMIRMKAGKTMRMKKDLTLPNGAMVLLCGALKMKDGRSHLLKDAD